MAPSSSIEKNLANTFKTARQIKGLQDPTARWQRERRLKSKFAFFQSLSQLFLPTFSTENPPGSEFSVTITVRKHGLSGIRVINIA